jgi:hypothetical protein
MDIVCLRNISINTLHKENDDDDDDDDSDTNNNNNNNNNNSYRKQPYWALHTYFGKY